MPELSFDVTHRYTSPDGVEIPLVIAYGGEEIQTTGYVDCGAEACIFSNEIGQLLGITLEKGEPKSFGPASGGTLQTFGHLVSLEIFGITVESVVYFAKYPGLRRNLLGRSGWLSKLTLVWWNLTAQPFSVTSREPVQQLSHGSNRNPCLKRSLILRTFCKSSSGFCGASRHLGLGRRGLV